MNLPCLNRRLMSDDPHKSPRRLRMTRDNETAAGSGMLASGKPSMGCRVRLLETVLGAFGGRIVGTQRAVAMTVSKAVT